MPYPNCPNLKQKHREASLYCLPAGLNLLNFSLYRQNADRVTTTQNYSQTLAFKIRKEVCLFLLLFPKINVESEIQGKGQLPRAGLTLRRFDPMVLWSKKTSHEDLQEIPFLRMFKAHKRKARRTIVSMKDGTLHSTSCVLGVMISFPRIGDSFKCSSECIHYFPCSDSCSCAYLCLSL